VVGKIITALSRIGWLVVIARNSSFSPQSGQAVDLKQVGRELRVRYVLQNGAEASSALRRAGIVRIGATRADFSAVSGSESSCHFRLVAPLT